MTLSTHSSLQATPFHGLVGSGLIGVDPFHRKTWSGISQYFFSECDRLNILAGASGGEIRGWRKYFLLGLQFHAQKSIWRMRYYLDPRYRCALTLAMKPKIAALPPGRAVLQIGGLFDAPSVAKGERLCFSYHDGNLAMRLRNPFGSLGLGERESLQALAYERDLYHRLDFIFTMSDYLRESFIEDFGIPANKVANIGAGANLDWVPEISPSKDYANQQLLFIGVDFERKGGKVLLQAFALVRSIFPEAVLNIVGPKAAPPDLPLEGVIWHGFLDKAVPREAGLLLRLLNESCLFLLPSLYEPFGIAPVEAMLYGMPAIVSGSWALAESVVDDITGLHVEPGNVQELAQSIVSLLEDPHRIKVLGCQARVHALENFTWTRVVEKLQARLEEQFPLSSAGQFGADRTR